MTYKVVFRRAAQREYADAVFVVRGAARRARCGICVRGRACYRGGCAKSTSLSGYAPGRPLHSRASFSLFSVLPYRDDEDCHSCRLPRTKKPTHVAGPRITSDCDAASSHRGLPRRVVADHGVERRDDFSDAGGERDLFVFAGTD